MLAVPCARAGSYSNFMYSVNGTNLIITTYSGSSIAITIPATVPEVGTVTAIGNGAFQLNYYLLSVNIPTSVTSIGNGAFFYCKKLRPLWMPDTITNIGSVAFFYCLTLSSVHFSESLKTIGSNAFYQSSLLNVCIPDSVVTIENEAFSTCRYMTNAVIGNGVSNLPQSAFSNCISLANVTIGSHVASIGYSAFKNCSKLTNASFLGNAPTQVGQYAFSGAASNFTIYYPYEATGWSTPLWRGYPARPYNPNNRSQVGVKRGAESITPCFNWLKSGSNYQLQISSDLVHWSDSGEPFSATDASQDCSQCFVTTNASPFFFRLKANP
jgi:hypothetical protein